jgi:peptide/nickel transport system substrate-binding protein
VTCTRLMSALLVGGVIALAVLGPAFARSEARSKDGGVLVVGVSSGDPDTLDPTLSRTVSALEVFDSFCEQLYDFDSTSRIVPRLAAALPVVSKDKLSYTIALRQGVEFNDGTPFNAQAVVTTIQRMITLPGSSRASDFSSVDSVTASGPYTAVIHLSTPFTPLTATLATNDGVVLSPTQLAKLGANFGTNPVCVGPFMFDHRVAGDNVTVIKSPYYYNQGAVHLDKIVYKAMPDTAAAAAALKAGDLQALDSISSTELPGITQTSSLRVTQTNSLGWRGIAINLGNRSGVGSLPYTSVGSPLASSAKLRQAFEEAIDRNAMSKVVFGGVTQAGCTPVAPASPTFDASIECTPYNPADARKLVAQSGFSNPTVHLLAPNLTDMLRLAQFIQAQEAAVGIDVVIDAVDNATLTSLALKGAFDTALLGPSGNADTDRNIYPYAASAGSRNYGGYSSPRLDLILANARKATSAKALKTLYHVAEQILVNDRPIIFLYHPVRSAGVNSGVTGARLSADLLLHVAFAQYK